jgi:FkbM family methyltransferase
MRPPRPLAAAIVRRLLSPIVPDSKRLPFSYWLVRLSGGNVPELPSLDKFFASTGTAIDVGANEGLFTYRLSKYFRRVYAFEVNVELTAAISDYNPGNITLYPCGLSSTARTAKLHIPVTHGFASAGWGSIEHSAFPDAKYTIEKDVQVKPLDDFGIDGVDFIKIDVEGHELEVLKGATATIKKFRPVLLVEVQDENLPAAKLWFQKLGYSHASINDIFKLKKRDNPNYVFAPPEKLARLGIRANTDRPEC